MAYERTKSDTILGDSLDGFVTLQLKNYSNQIAKKSAEDEANFSRLVLEQGIPLEAQLAYREEQAKNTDDVTEKKRIMGEVSTLKQRIEYQKYSDEYIDKLTDYETGISSIESVINWLEDKKSSVTDPTMLTKIKESLSTMEAKRYELQQSALKDHTDYALKDKTETVINDQLTALNNARAKALIAGRTDEAETLNLQIQSLNQAKAANAIDKTAKSFAISTLSGYQNASGLLDSYNAQINNADSTTPVTIGGTTYDSAKEYWTLKRDGYISDESANGFFGRFKDEQVTAVKVKNSANLLSDNDLKASAAALDALASRSELASNTTPIK